MTESSCQNCGAPRSATGDFCASCGARHGAAAGMNSTGAPVESRCVNCGRPTQAGASRCEECVIPPAPVPPIGTPSYQSYGSPASAGAMSRRPNPVARYCAAGHVLAPGVDFCPVCGSPAAVGAWVGPPGVPGVSGVPVTVDDRNQLSKIAMVCGGIAFLILPVIFGPAGLILGAVAMTKGERLASVALAVAGSGFIAGMVIGAATWGY